MECKIQGANMDKRRGRLLLITEAEAVDRSFQIAYLVAQAILTDEHKECQGCAICDLIKTVIMEHKANKNKNSRVIKTDKNFDGILKS